MELTALGGNLRLKGQLAQQEGGEGLSHAYIVAGLPGTGRHTLVTALAAAAQCRQGGTSAPCGQCGQCKKVFAGIHLDVTSVGEDKPLLVDEVRELRSDVYIRPNEGLRKVYILWNSDKMKESSQNALLKVVEEGPKYALFLLVADNEGGILQTLRSRSELLALQPAPPVVDESFHQLVEPLVAALRRGDEVAAIGATISLEKVEKERILPLISHLQTRLIAEAVQGENRKLLLRGGAFCATIQQGARQNVGAAQLFGWFVAQLFSPEMS